MRITRRRKSIKLDQSVEILSVLKASRNKEPTNIKAVDDSGFGEGSDSFIVFDDSNDIITLDDEFHVETLIEEQNKYLEETCRRRKCFVQVFNFSVEYDSNGADVVEEAVEEANIYSKTIKNPKKSRNILTNVVNDSPNKTLTPTRRSILDKSTRKRKNCDSTDNSFVEQKLDTRQNRRKQKPPSEYAMSPYEKIREDNIREREEMFKALRIKEGFEEFKQEVGIRNKYNYSRKFKSASSDSDNGRRRSSRLVTKDDVDYVPEGGEDDDKYAIDDPINHTHGGLKKHPCKDCSNCLQEDCRRCIYCRDKLKYGGMNIKKQRCEFKMKCSNPIIICFICKGKRSFSCGVCGKKFHEMYQLEEHNENIHEEDKVKRRSSRISVMETIDFVDME